MEDARPKWLRSTKGAPFTGIGSLEADILAVVWEKDETTVRAVYETLRERRTIAYTTVMTVMNNLVKKHLLDAGQDRHRVRLHAGHPRAARWRRPCSRAWCTS